MHADIGQLNEWLNNYHHIICMGIIYYFIIATKAVIRDVGLCVHWSPSWDRQD
jgi:hypothetical protein